MRQLLIETKYSHSKEIQSLNHKSSNTRRAWGAGCGETVWRTVCMYFCTLINLFPAWLTSDAISSTLILVFRATHALICAKTRSRSSRAISASECETYIYTVTDHQFLWNNFTWLILNFKKVICVFLKERVRDRELKKKNKFKNAPKFVPWIRTIYNTILLCYDLSSAFLNLPVPQELHPFSARLAMLPAEQPIHAAAEVLPLCRVMPP